MWGGRVFPLSPALPLLSATISFMPVVKGKHYPYTAKGKAAAKKAAKTESGKAARASGRAALKAAKALPGPAKIAGVAAVGLGTYIAGRRSGKRAGSKVNIGNAGARARKRDYYG